MSEVYFIEHRNSVLLARPTEDDRFETFSLSLPDLRQIVDGLSWEGEIEDEATEREEDVDENEHDRGTEVVEPEPKLQKKERSVKKSNSDNNGTNGLSKSCRTVLEFLKNNNCSEGWKKIDMLSHVKLPDSTTCYALKRLIENRLIHNIAKDGYQRYKII